MKKTILAALLGLAVVPVLCAGTTSYLSQIRVKSTHAGPTCATSGTSDGYLCAQDGVESEGVLNVAGASTLTGLVTAGGGIVATSIEVTGTATLTSADCGQAVRVTAGIDTETITLPATIDGCQYRFVYTGADGGALVDISPNASDAIHGSCTLAASVLEFSGSDDADIGLTKATANTGDTITLEGDGGVGWFVSACAGIWANN